MPCIAHRRRGSEFGHHPFVFALVTPPLLPLALVTLSLRDLLVLNLRFQFQRTLRSPSASISTCGDTAVSRHWLLSLFRHSAPASILTAGPLLCL